MKLALALISPRRASPRGPAADLIQLYLERLNQYLPTELLVYSAEIKLLSFVENTVTRAHTTLLLADSGGKQITSPDLASMLGILQDNGSRQIVFAIGPADGWSTAAMKRADHLVAFGRITLPHELAAVVAAEQLYRALTIRAGHPYHCGH